MPESCILIAIGVLLGAIIFGTNHKAPPAMRTDIYFLYLLPPIILEGGYFLPTRPFFENIGTITWWAVVGTLMNALGIGFSLFGICQIEAFGISDVSLLQNLLFGSLIAAVDPVAVLAVFEEASVNEQLYMMIFGESLLNDGITVVLYNLFISFTNMHTFETIEPVDIFAGMARFVIVGLGGVLFGIVFGFFSAFVTRFTRNISSIEPLLVFMFSYLSYLSAEMLYLSGILAMTACAMTMKKYVQENVSQNSNTTIKYFMKMLSSVSETLIFIFMGVSTVGKNLEWNWAFVCFTLLFCLIWRVMSVFLLFYIINHFRTFPFALKDQFIIAYSGLRGASSFSLVFLLPVSLFPRKKMFITSTIVIIYFTVFIQGITIGPLVKYLGVKKTSKKQSVNEEIHMRLMDHLKAGIEDVCGHWGHYQFREKYKKFDNTYLRRILSRENQPKSSIVSLYKKLELKQAIEMTEIGISRDPSVASLQSYRDQRVKRLSPEEEESMRDLLTHNLYQIRQTTLSYSKYYLPNEESERQTEEILVRRYNSLKASKKKGQSLPRERPAVSKNVRYLSFPNNISFAHGRDAMGVTFTDDQGNLSTDNNNPGTSTVPPKKKKKTTLTTTEVEQENVTAPTVSTTHGGIDGAEVGAPTTTFPGQQATDEQELVILQMEPQEEEEPVAPVLKKRRRRARVGREHSDLAGGSATPSQPRNTESIPRSQTEVADHNRRSTAMLENIAANVRGLNSGIRAMGNSMRAGRVSNLHHQRFARSRMRAMVSGIGHLVHAVQRVARRVGEAQRDMSAALVLLGDIQARQDVTLQAMAVTLKSLLPSVPAVSTSSTASTSPVPSSPAIECNRGEEMSEGGEAQGSTDSTTSNQCAT